MKAFSNRKETSYGKQSKRLSVSKADEKPHVALDDDDLILQNVFQHYVLENLHFDQWTSASGTL